MFKNLIRFSVVLFIVVLVLGMSVEAVQAAATAQADKVAQGKYLTEIAGCVSCHTPYVPQIDLSKPQTIKPEDLGKMVFSERDVLDTSARLLAGGRAFDLGPNGIWFTRNLTPDNDTGLGTWTDDEIKTAIRTGKTKRGTVLFPLMPYAHFNSMADADVDAIVAYLRTIPAVKNPVPPNQSIPNLQPIPERKGLVAPAATDTQARGKYLMSGVLPCTDCHTPIDNATGAPVMTKYLGGGQPFEGPWGIVYGGNLTPHETNGIGKWSDADIRRVLSSGIRPDGRRLVAMPWQDYAQLSEADAQAVVAYLRKGVTAVDSLPPAGKINPDFVKKVDLPATQAASNDFTLYIIIGVVVLAVVGGAAFFLMRRGAAAK